MKQKRISLKVEFKQVQRLPDWPIINHAVSAARASEEAFSPKAPDWSLPTAGGKYDSHQRSGFPRLPMDCLSGATAYCLVGG